MESDNRIGGRVFTIKKKDKQGNEWYGDMGAMRFPPKTQPIVNGVNQTDILMLKLVNSHYNCNFSAAKAAQERTSFQQCNLHDS